MLATLKRFVAPPLYTLLYQSSRLAHDGGISILSYHSIDNNGTPLSVSPPLFRAHLAALAKEGCSTFTMQEVADHLALELPFPPHAVAITFDDAFANVAEVAYPLLQNFGMSATIYVITGMVGRTTRWTDRGTSLPSLPIMNWDYITEAQKGGMEIGAHSITHGFLTQYGPRALHGEMRGSKHILEERLGVPVRSFAYPQGDYNRAVAAAAQSAGYSTAVTVDQGRATVHSNPFRLPRLLVGNNTTPTVLRAFIVPGIGPAYRLVNLVMRRALGRKRWPRRAPGEVDSTGSAEL